MQHHFVVMYDTETGKWGVETEYAGFFDGTIWDTNTDQWCHAIDDGEIYVKDEELYDKLIASIEENLN